MPGVGRSSGTVFYECLVPERMGPLCFIIVIVGWNSGIEVLIAGWNGRTVAIAVVFSFSFYHVCLPSVNFLLGIATLYVLMYNERYFLLCANLCFDSVS